jgi:hypothetical protein
MPRAGATLPGLLAFRSLGVEPGGPPVAVAARSISDFCKTYYYTEGRRRQWYEPLSGWKYDNWPLGSLWTLFKDRAALTTAGKVTMAGSGDVRDISLESDYLGVVQERMLPRDGKIPVADFLAWRFRVEPIPDAQTFTGLKGQMLDELRLNQDEVATLFEGPLDLTSEEASFFTEQDWPSRVLLDMLPEETGGSAPDDERTDSGRALEMDDLISCLTRVLDLEEHFEVPEVLVANLLTALRIDRFVVLAGKSGTGKTQLVRSLARSLARCIGLSEVVLIEVAVSDQTAEWQLVGTRDISGEYVPSQLLTDLAAGSDAAIRIVLLDEMNLASVDSYAAQLISAVTNGISIELPGREPARGLAWYPQNGRWLPPAGTVIIGTLNSYLEEEARLPLSGPVTRRANVIHMPDILSALACEQDEAAARRAFSDICFRRLLPQLRERAAGLATSGLHRTVSEELAQPPEPAVLDLLWQLARALASRVEVAFTLGLVQSVLGYCAISPLSTDDALDLQIVQKVLPVIRGDEAVLMELEAVVPRQYARSISAISQMRVVAAENAGLVRPLY